MRLKKSLLISIVAAVLLVVGLIVLKSKSNTIPPSLTKISSTNMSQPTISASKAYFVSGDGAQIDNIDLGTGKAEKVVSPGGTIDNFLVTKGGDKIFIQTHSGDNYTSLLYNVGSKNLNKLESCALSFAWSDDEKSSFYNCFQQEYDYDPNSINALKSASADGHNGRKIYDFKIDPPKKIVAVPGGILIQTNSPGYNTNDLLLFDANNQSVSNISKDGFVTGFVLSSDKTQAIFLSNGGANGVYFLNLKTGDKRKILGIAALDTRKMIFDQKNNALVIAAYNEANSKYHLVKVDLDSTAENVLYDFSGTGKDYVSALLAGSDGKLYYTGKDGLFRINFYNLAI